MKKKQKKKIIKGSLCLIASFFFILISCYEKTIEKDNISLITYNDKKIFTNVLEENLINTLETETGAVLLINSKKDINKYIDLLYEANNKENIFFYNLKNDELVLELDKNGNVKVKQEPSTLYKKLLKYLGSYTENYTITNTNNEIIETKYKKVYTPMVLFISDGNVLFSHYIYDETITDEDLINIYKQGFETIKKYNS